MGRRALSLRVTCKVAESTNKSRCAAIAPRTAFCCIARRSHAWLMDTLEYFLHPKTFLCSAPRHWVLLDVRADRYLCLNLEDVALLRPWLNGQNEDDATDARPDVMPAQAAALMQQLLDRELLIPRAASARPVTPTRWALPTQTLQLSTTSGLLASIVHAPTFVYSSIFADHALRRRSLEVISGRVSRHRAQQSRNRPFPWETTSRVIATFNTLRLFYPRSYLCLFDCLALLQFLSFHSIFPTWVFGVVADPFSAHCWLQQGDVVLNDTVETVAKFTPIMCL